MFFNIICFCYLRFIAASPFLSYIANRNCKCMYIMLMFIKSSCKGEWKWYAAKSSYQYVPQQDKAMDVLHWRKESEWMCSIQMSRYFVGYKECIECVSCISYANFCGHVTQYTVIVQLYTHTWFSQKCHILPIIFFIFFIHV